MPEITAIEPQKKTKDRFNIFLDGKFAFGVSQTTAVLENLQIGKIITRDQIEKILKGEEFSRLQDSTMRFLNFRPRSEKEVRIYLTKKIAQKENVKFSQAKESPYIQKIIEKLKKYKFIDDLEFAKWFTSSRLKSHQKSTRLISWELKAKGIDQDIIEKVKKGLGSEKDLAERAVSKKIKRWRSLPHLEFKKKFYQYLSSRGFSYETIKDAFAKFDKLR